MSNDTDLKSQAKSFTHHRIKVTDRRKITWALAYAGRGDRVLPLHTIKDGACTCEKPDCRTPGKHPVAELAPHGAHSATSDLDIIRAWWGKMPDANIALTMDSRLAIDTDGRKGGWASLEKLLGEHFDDGEYAPAWEQESGSGDGEHHVFELPEGVEISASGYPGIDIKKGAGSYIVVEPSDHFSGGQYRWKPGCGPVYADEGNVSYDAFSYSEPGQPPAWLLERLKKAPATADDGEDEKVPSVEGVDVDALVAELPAWVEDKIACDIGEDKSGEGASGHSFDMGLLLFDDGFSTVEVFAVALEYSFADKFKARGKLALWKEIKRIRRHWIKTGGKDRKSYGKLDRYREDVSDYFDDEDAKEGTASEPKKNPYEIGLDGAMQYVKEGNWLIYEAMPAYGVMMHYGASQTGKTFFLLYVLLHIAYGKKWLGKDVEQGNVLYIAAEGGRMFPNRVLKAREALTAAKVLGPEDVNKFGHMNVAPNLGAAEGDIKTLRAEIRKYVDKHNWKPRVIALDTKSSMTPGGDENAQKDVSIFLANAKSLADEFECLVVFVHHTGKDEDKGARGSYSLIGDTECVWESKEAKGGNKELNIKKQKEGRTEYTLADYSLNRVDIGPDSKGNMVTTCVVDATLNGAQPVFEDETAKYEYRWKVAEQVIAAKRYRTNHKSPDWAGYAIARGLGMEDRTKETMTQEVKDDLTRLLEDMVAKERIQVVERKDGNSILRDYYELILTPEEEGFGR